MKTIYKYTIDPSTERVRMTLGAEIISVHEQHGQICLWAIVDQEEKRTESREFAIYPTGEPILNFEYRKYVGTVYLNNASLVFHVFEVIA